MYTAISSDNSSGVKYTVTVVPKNPNDSPVASAEKAFKELLKEKRKGSIERGNPKISVLVECKDAPKSDSEDMEDSEDEEDSEYDEDSEDEEGKPETDQFYEPLWLPECYRE